MNTLQNENNPAKQIQHKKVGKKDDEIKKNSTKQQ
jgi:hypothetical protein